jgi:hypothetical protein
MTETLNLTIREKEERKFEITPEGEVALRTNDSSGFNIPNFDFIDFSNTSSIKFYSGGSGGTLVTTLTITGSSVEKT